MSVYEIDLYKEKTIVGSSPFELSMPIMEIGRDTKQIDVKLEILGNCAFLPSAQPATVTLAFYGKNNEDDNTEWQLMTDTPPGYAGDPSPSSEGSVSTWSRINLFRYMKVVLQATQMDGIVAVLHSLKIIFKD